MLIQPLDPRPLERSVNTRVQIVRHRNKARGARPIRIPMDDSLVVEDRRPRLGEERCGHEASVTPARAR
jgi:hypothetical protein